jgi:hypothetical protein
VLSAGELEIAQRHIERGLELYEVVLPSVPISLYTTHHPPDGAQVLWIRAIRARHSGAVE